jgi:YggT family protein
MNVLMFLLDLVFLLLIGACLLRAWLNHARISMAQQPGPFILAVSGWLVMPLRRLLPPAWQRSRWDVASVTAAVLLALVQAVLWQVILNIGMGIPGLEVSLAWVTTVWLALKLLVVTALRLLMYLVLAQAVLSWVQPYSPVQGWLNRLLMPWLAPLRRVIPPVGGVDLSGLVLLVLIQVALMLIG